MDLVVAQVVPRIRQAIVDIENELPRLKTHRTTIDNIYEKMRRVYAFIVHVELSILNEREKDVVRELLETILKIKKEVLKYRQKGLINRLKSGKDKSRLNILSTQLVSLAMAIDIDCDGPMPYEDASFYNQDMTDEEQYIVRYGTYNLPTDRKQKDATENGIEIEDSNEAKDEDENIRLSQLVEGMGEGIKNDKIIKLNDLLDSDDDENDDIIGILSSPKHIFQDNQHSLSASIEQTHDKHAFFLWIVDVLYQRADPDDDEVEDIPKPIEMLRYIVEWLIKDNSCPPNINEDDLYTINYYKIDEALEHLMYGYIQNYENFDEISHVSLILYKQYLDILPNYFVNLMDIGIRYEHNVLLNIVSSLLNIHLNRGYVIQNYELVSSLCSIKLDRFDLYHILNMANDENMQQLLGKYGFISLLTNLLFKNVEKKIEKETIGEDIIKTTADQDEIDDSDFDIVYEVEIHTDHRLIVRALYNISKHPHEYLTNIDPGIYNNLLNLFVEYFDDVNCIKAYEIDQTEMLNGIDETTKEPSNDDGREIDKYKDDLTYMILYLINIYLNNSNVELLSLTSKQKEGLCRCLFLSDQNDAYYALIMGILDQSQLGEMIVLLNFINTSIENIRNNDQVDLQLSIIYYNMSYIVEFILYDDINDNVIYQFIDIGGINTFNELFTLSDLDHVQYNIRETMFFTIILSVIDRFLENPDDEEEQEMEDKEELSLYVMKCIKRIEDYFFPNLLNLLYKYSGVDYSLTKYIVSLLNEYAVVFDSDLEWLEFNDQDLFVQPIRRWIDKPNICKPLLSILERSKEKIHKESDMIEWHNLILDLTTILISILSLHRSHPIIPKKCWSLIHCDFRDDIIGIFIENEGIKLISNHVDEYKYDFEMTTILVDLIYRISKNDIYVSYLNKLNIYENIIPLLSSYKSEEDLSYKLLEILNELCIDQKISTYLGNHGLPPILNHIFQRHLELIPSSNRHKMIISLLTLIYTLSFRHSQNSFNLGDSNICQTVIDCIQQYYKLYLDDNNDKNTIKKILSESFASIRSLCWHDKSSVPDIINKIRNVSIDTTEKLIINEEDEEVKPVQRKRRESSWGRWEEGNNLIEHINIPIFFDAGIGDVILSCYNLINKDENGGNNTIIYHICAIIRHIVRYSDIYCMEFRKKEFINMMKRMILQSNYDYDITYITLEIIQSLGNDFDETNIDLSDIKKSLSDYYTLELLSNLLIYYGDIISKSENNSIGVIGSNELDLINYICSLIYYITVDDIDNVRINGEENGIEGIISLNRIYLYLLRGGVLSSELEIILRYLHILTLNMIQDNINIDLLLEFQLQQIFNDLLNELAHDLSYHFKYTYIYICDITCNIIMILPDKAYFFIGLLDLLVSRLQVSLNVDRFPDESRSSNINNHEEHNKIEYHTKRESKLNADLSKFQQLFDKYICGNITRTVTTLYSTNKVFVSNLSINQIEKFIHVLLKLVERNIRIRETYNNESNYDSTYSTMDLMDYIGQWKGLIIRMNRDIFQIISLLIIEHVYLEKYFEVFFNLIMKIFAIHEKDKLNEEENDVLGEDVLFKAYRTELTGFMIHTLTYILHQNNEAIQNDDSNSNLIDLLCSEYNLTRLLYTLERCREYSEVCGVIMEVLRLIQVFDVSIQDMYDIQPKVKKVAKNTHRGSTIGGMFEAQSIGINRRSTVTVDNLHTRNNSSGNLLARKNSKGRMPRNHHRKTSSRSSFDASIERKNSEIQDDIETKVQEERQNKIQATIEKYNNNALIIINSNIISTIVNLLNRHYENDYIIIQACQLITNLGMHDILCAQFSRYDAPNILTRLLRQHHSNSKTSEYILYAISSLAWRFATLYDPFIGNIGNKREKMDKAQEVKSEYRGIRNQFFEHETCKIITKTLHNHISNPTLCEAACLALGRLAIDPQNGALFIEARAVDGIMEAFGHINMGNVAEKVLGAVARLSEDNKTICNMFCERGACDAIIAAYNIHSEHVGVCSEFCRCIRAIITNTENTDQAYYFEEMGVVPILMTIGTNHFENRFLAKHLSHVLCVFANSGADINIKIGEAGGLEIMKNIFLFHKSNTVVIKAGLVALRVLGKEFSNRSRIGELGIIQCLVDVIMLYRNNGPICEIGCKCISIIAAASPQNKRKFKNYNAKLIPFLTSLLKTYLKNNAQKALDILERS